jgi:hypothetical protein
MKITYRYGFRDRLAFAAYHLSRKPLVLLITLGTLLFFPFESVLPALQSLPADRSMVIKIILFVITELVLVIALVSFWAAITVVTMISTKNKPLYCERTLAIGDDTFVTESEYGRSETKWSLIQKLARTRTHIFMYLNQESAVIIPRHAFENTTQWDTFYEICRRNKSRVT